MESARKFKIFQDFSGFFKIFQNVFKIFQNVFKILEQILVYLPGRSGPSTRAVGRPRYKFWCICQFARGLVPERSEGGGCVVVVVGNKTMNRIYKVAEKSTYIFKKRVFGKSPPVCLRL